MNNEVEIKNNLTKEEADSLKGANKSILGGYPIGTKEFFALTYFLWITSFFMLFITIRTLVILSGI